MGLGDVMGLSRAGAQGHPNGNLGPRHLLDHHLDGVMPPAMPRWAGAVSGAPSRAGQDPRGRAIMICVFRAFLIVSDRMFKLFSLVLELLGPSKPRPTLETS